MHGFRLKNYAEDVKISSRKQAFFIVDIVREKFENCLDVILDVEDSLLLFGGKLWCSSSRLAAR